MYIRSDENENENTRSRIHAFHFQFRLPLWFLGAKQLGISNVSPPNYSIIPPHRGLFSFHLSPDDNHQYIFCLITPTRTLCHCFPTSILSLRRLPYIPISALVQPPATSWLSIDDEVFAPLGKTREVLHLLRHLPYLEGEQRNIAYDTKVITFHV